ncbi:cell division protein DamX [Scandinavium sp. H11S7]|uniref:cell division protein DamX n=1 Tax=Scandinavium hiltneri TaxID=2926519 RepID=UPI002165A0BA|nr:cell division protein DamX [Scandinavium hiltneri]MCS2157389.1 cell division protein DamX [Scandinavium hiltneri]
MDEFKPEDDLKPDPSDRRAGRSRQSSDRENDQQINFDDVDLDADERRPSRTRKVREEREEQDEEAYYDESEEDLDAEEPVEQRLRKRKKKPASKPASRQYIMMGVGILVLLLLIVGIGSALKAPSSSSEQASTDAKSIDLAANNGAPADQANGAQPAPGTAPVDPNAANSQQEVSLPPISSTPTQGQNTAAPQGQQRVEVQGDLNNALTQQQGQIDGAVANSTLPTEPATVAPVRNGSASRQPTNTAESAPAATTRPERKHAVIEPKPQSKPQATAKAVEPKPVAQPKHTETAATSTPAKSTAPVVEPAKPAATSTAKPAATTTAPAAAAPAAAATATAATATAAGKETGDVGSLKTAPGSQYTLQLSSSSNYDNLNNWARKENIQKYVVYQTTRNGQPWYVLVSGMYATKDDAKRAVAALPANVQAKNPWAKPLHQVQSDLKQ